MVDRVIYNFSFTHLFSVASLLFFESATLGNMQLYLRYGNKKVDKI